MDETLKQQLDELVREVKELSLGPPERLKALRAKYADLAVSIPDYVNHLHLVVWEPKEPKEPRKPPRRRSRRRGPGSPRRKRSGS